MCTCVCVGLLRIVGIYACVFLHFWDMYMEGYCVCAYVCGCGCGCHDVRSGSFFAMPPFIRALCGAVKA